MFLTACANQQDRISDVMTCPDKPNCVSSLDSASSHYIEPYTYSDSADVAMQRLKQAILSEERIAIIKEDSEYLHLEARSFIFRFVDDVQFKQLPKEGLIHIRSASRTGYSDLGVNRRRLERIRKLFQQ